MFFIDFRERGRGEIEGNMGVRENISRLPPVNALTRDQTHHLGMGPDWELNPQSFGAWDDAPTSWTTWRGLLCFYLNTHTPSHCRYPGVPKITRNSPPFYWLIDWLILFLFILLVVPIFPFALLCPAHVTLLPQSTPTPLSMSLGHSYMLFD